MKNTSISLTLQHRQRIFCLLLGIMALSAEIRGATCQSLPRSILTPLRSSCNTSQQLRYCSILRNRLVKAGIAISSTAAVIYGMAYLWNMYVDHLTGLGAAFHPTISLSSTSRPYTTVIIPRQMAIEPETTREPDRLPSAITSVNDVSPDYYLNIPNLTARQRLQQARTIHNEDNQRRVIRRRKQIHRRTHHTNLIEQHASSQHAVAICQGKIDIAQEIRALQAQENAYHQTRAERLKSTDPRRLASQLKLESNLEVLRQRRRSTAEATNPEVAQKEKESVIEVYAIENLEKALELLAPDVEECDKSLQQVIMRTGKQYEYHCYLQSITSYNCSESLP